MRRWHAEHLSVADPNHSVSEPDQRRLVPNLPVQPPPDVHVRVNDHGEAFSIYVHLCPSVVSSFVPRTPRP
jgi:hypothetical protein